jgi:hypothetical protein
MTLRFWRILLRRSRTSKVSSTSRISANSVMAAASVPEWIARLTHSADNLFLAAEIAACIVVGGVVIEDWDKLGMLFYRPSWTALRNAIGPIMIAGGIAFEILFSNRASSKERKVRSWYSLRIAELNLQAEQERHARVLIEEKLAARSLSDEQISVIAEKIAPFAGHGTRYSARNAAWQGGRATLWSPLLCAM